MQTKKKTVAVAVAAAVGSLAVGGAAWAWIAAQGSGSASATANATPGTVTLTGTASITDLDTPSAVTINGSADKKNRHISNVTVAINPAADLPGDCQASWFEVRKGETGEFDDEVVVAAPFTFAIANQTYQNIVPDVFVQLKNADADQSACVNNASLTDLLTLTAS